MTPRKAFHEAVEALALGHTTQMGEIMDLPAKWLKGQHQRVFHSPAEVLLLASMCPGNIVENFLAGMLHISMDQTVHAGKKVVNQIAKAQKRSKKNVGNR